MSFDKSVEAIIKEAMQRGEFDGLGGRGHPLDLDAYFETPEDVRMVYSILKNAGMVPQEIDLLREIAALKENLAGAQGEETRRKLRREIAAKQLHLDVLLERQRHPRGRG